MTGEFLDGAFAGGDVRGEDSVFVYVICFDRSNPYQLRRVACRCVGGHSIFTGSHGPHVV
jgi:hypothetical protein